MKDDADRDHCEQHLHAGRLREERDAAGADDEAAVVFVIYAQLENHVLNSVVMGKTVRVSPLFVLVSVLVGASIGAWLGGVLGGLVAALLAIPTAAAMQTVILEL